MSSNRFIQIDEEGYFLSMGIRITDETYGLSLFENLHSDNRGFVTHSQNEPVIVEAFDQPLIARSIEILSSSRAKVYFPYGFSQTIDFADLKADFWDRFHARSIEKNLPLVLSRTAQMDLFNAADSFDDTSLTIAGKRAIVRDFYESEKKVDNPNFWADQYEAWQKNAEEKPGWELDGPARPLDSILQQLKIPRSRIGVLGCGTGHDAAFLAERGHIVTGVDWSEQAITTAEKRYGKDNKSLRFINDEVFDFAKQNPTEFDIVFEHTFFCAIAPVQREKLVQSWRRVLLPDGHLLAIFFILDNVGGPPFGLTEWEVREHLKDHFEFLYWTRAKNSIPQRLGKELIVYAKKRG
jgi:SAM-dependent methyltransferase